MPNDIPSQINYEEKRKKARRVYPSNRMLEIKLPGVPLYQLKIQDLSEDGVGVIVKPDSPLLPFLKLGREVSISLISPGDSVGPWGKYQATVEHISEVEEGPYHGNLIIGLSFHTGFHSA